MNAATFNCIVMGAAGRDLHDFQTFFRANPQYRVVAFTATQIPFIETRTVPAQLGGAAYEADIPIHLESELPALIERLNVDFVFFAYSDIAHTELMHRASLVQSCGAAFVLLGPHQTQLASSRPVIAITAVRTGAGKSPLTQWLAHELTARGQRAAVIRHPMPYGDLIRQRVQHFAGPDDLDRYECTIEEREEYQPYLDMGLSVFAGVDYEQILRAAEKDCDVILWDGGNNDYPFLRADLSLVVTDALRPGHEVAYYPGETNLRSADIVVINKADGADRSSVETIRRNVERLNPSAAIVESTLEVTVDDPQQIAGALRSGGRRRPHVDARRHALRGRIALRTAGRRSRDHRSAPVRRRHNCRRVPRLLAYRESAAGTGILARPVRGVVYNDRREQGGTRCRRQSGRPRQLPRPGDSDCPSPLQVSPAHRGIPGRRCHSLPEWSGGSLMIGDHKRRRTERGENAAERSALTTPLFPSYVEAKSSGDGGTRSATMLPV